jgi:hypothetical protein
MLAYMRQIIFNTLDLIKFYAQVILQVAGEMVFASLGPITA